MARRADMQGRSRDPARAAFIKDLENALYGSRRIGEHLTLVVNVDPAGCSRISKVESTATSNTASHLLPPAHLRPRTLAAEILRRDDMLSAKAFAELIGTGLVTVYEKRMKQQVLALDGPKRGLRFPAWQLDRDGKPFAALPALFGRFGGNPWTVYRFLVMRHPELDGMTGIEALYRDQTDRVFHLADGIDQGSLACAEPSFATIQAS